MAEEPKDEMTQETLSFEEAMSQLEVIVNKLEENEVPLEEAITLFQRGIELSKLCNKTLQRVEDQMDRILSEDGSLKPFKLQEDEQS